MTKSDKKLEKALVNALTNLCELYKNKALGFSWLTHTGTIAPLSLQVTCVFTSNEQLTLAITEKSTQAFEQDIRKVLSTIFGKQANKKCTIWFDSEENCQLTNQGNWQQRLHKKH